MGTQSQDVVYVVTDGINHRVRQVYALKPCFAKMLLFRGRINPLARHRTAPISDGVTAIRPFPNPLIHFRRLGFERFCDWLESYVYFPSTHILYTLRATKLLEALVARDLDDGKGVCLLTCVPPHAIALLGLRLKRRFPQIRWIVDWQDLWSYDEYYSLRTPQMHRKRMLKAEKAVLETSDLNITTNERAKEVLQSVYGVRAEGAVSIPHHFCREELDGVTGNAVPPQAEGHRAIRLGFLGNLFKLPKMPGGRVVEAVQHAVAMGLNVQLHVFGDQSDELKEAARALKGVVFVHPPAGHEQSLRNVAACDFLLLAMSELPNCRAVMNIKLPHYLMVGKPIVAMVPQDSAVADIIRATGTGYVIPSTSDWRSELWKVLRDHINGRTSIQRDERAIEQYSWERISERWLEALGGGMTRPVGVESSVE